jgi:hypothetical protein
MKGRNIFIPIFLFSVIITCSNSFAQNDVFYYSGSTKKIEQLIGDWDKHFQKPTSNLTSSRYGLNTTDLGVPFEHKGRTYLLFGDIPPKSNNRDPIAFTDDKDPSNGMSLNFITGTDGLYRPIEIPDVSMGGYEVPMEGISWRDVMYIYVATETMTRSIVARSDDDGHTFTKLYELSNSKFVNVSLTKTKSTSDYPEPINVDIQIILGSGLYRKSNIFLAYQRSDQVDQKSLKYFKEVINGKPIWTTKESEAQALFNQPCVGELSLSYNKFIRKWIVLYNCDKPRGINCRTSDNPWGPWSDPFVIFDPSAKVDKGYCNFIHSSWTFNKCDFVHDLGRENEWGGEYGPYQFEEMAKGDDTSTTIYYTLSTWNPYTVVLMESKLLKDRSTSASIHILESNEVEIYPNPTSEILNIKLGNMMFKGVTLELLNFSGKSVFIDKISDGQKNDIYEFNISHFPAGVYLVKLNLPDFTQPVVRKLIIK